MKYYTILIIAIVIILLWRILRVEKFGIQDNSVHFNRITDRQNLLQKLSNPPAIQYQINVPSNISSGLANWVNPNTMVSAEDCYQILTPEQIQQIEKSVLENFENPKQQPINLPAGSKQTSPTFLIDFPQKDSSNKTPFLTKDKVIVLEQETTDKQQQKSLLTPNDMQIINNTIEEQVNNLMSAIPSQPGPQGLQGPRGFPGVAGPMGPVGNQGPVGYTGAQGPQGYVGNDGPMGPTGSIGPTGATGQIGATGATGSQGMIGIMGPTGSQGIAGPRGPQGYQGEQGIQGLPGFPGKSYYLTKDEADNVNAYIEGAPGLQGLKGEPGTTGATGPVGPQGLIGYPGPVGPTGNAGPAGPIGKSGLTDIINTIGILFKAMTQKEQDTTSSANQSQIINDQYMNKGLRLVGNSLGDNGQGNVYLEDNAHVKRSLNVGGNTNLNGTLGIYTTENQQGSVFQVSPGNNKFNSNSTLLLKSGTPNNNPAGNTTLNVNSGSFDSGLVAGNNTLYVNDYENKRANLMMNLADSAGKTQSLGLNLQGQNSKNKGSVTLQSAGVIGNIEMKTQGGKQKAMNIMPSGQILVGEWDTTNDAGVFDGALNVKQVKPKGSTLNLTSMTDSNNIHFMGSNASLGQVGFNNYGAFMNPQGSPDNAFVLDKQGNLGLGKKPQAKLDLSGKNANIRMSDGNSLIEMGVNNGFYLNDMNTKRGLNFANGNVGIGTTNPTTQLDLNGSMIIRNGNMLVDKQGFIFQNEKDKQKVLELKNNNVGIQIENNMNPQNMLSFGPNNTPTKINLYDNGEPYYPGVGSMTGRDVYVHLKDASGSFAVYDNNKNKNNLMTITGSGKFGIRNNNPSGDLCIDNTCLNKNDIYQMVLNNKLFMGADTNKGMVPIKEGVYFKISTIPRLSPTFEPIVNGGSTWFGWIGNVIQRNDIVILMTRQSTDTMGLAIVNGSYVFGFVGLDKDDPKSLEKQVLGKMNVMKKSQTIQAIAGAQSNTIQIGVSFIYADTSVVMNMYVNGVKQWTNSVPFNPIWKLTPGDMFYGSPLNSNNQPINCGMTTFFGTPMSNNDVNQMYWLQRDNLTFN